MKLNIRSIAMFLAFGLLASANAQDVYFKLVYADSAGAALNGRNVGDELLPTTRISAIGSSLNVSLVAESLKDASYGLAQLMICFDQRTVFHNGNYSTKAKFDADTIDKKLDIPNLPPAVDGILYPLQTLAGDDAGFGPKGVYSRNYSAAFSTNAMGMYCAFNFGTALACKMPLGSSITMVTFALTNKNLAPNETYGDSEDEVEAMIFGQQNAPTRTTVLGSNIGSAQQLTSKKYAIQAVPEPATLGAIGVSLAGLIFRRRRA